MCQKYSSLVLNSQKEVQFIKRPIVLLNKGYKSVVNFYPPNLPCLMVSLFLRPNPVPFQNFHGHALEKYCTALVCLFLLTTFRTGYGYSVDALSPRLAGLWYNTSGVLPSLSGFFQTFPISESSEPGKALECKRTRHFLRCNRFLLFLVVCCPSASFSDQRPFHSSESFR